MIIVHFMGGFANQIFQYAFYLKLSEIYGSTNIFADISHFDNCKDHGGFKLNSFVKLQYINITNDKTILINENNYSSFIYNPKKKYLFVGYWQDEKFFPSNKQMLYEIFNISKLKLNNKTILNEINSTTSVSIHIRRGDYLNNYIHGNIANEIYFTNAISYINSLIKNPSYFVFSDDIEWCKQNLEFNNKVTFISGNEQCVEQDIILMSQCKHNIISNSSFSWWAQELNKNPNKIVVTPEYWFNQKTESVDELKVKNSIKILNIKKTVVNYSNPFFTIIIPVYNAEYTIRRTLESVLNQTFRKIEIIIVNDCSTDNSLEILNHYEKNDTRIRIINNKRNSGCLYNRILGINTAKGLYTLFLDSDDWLEKDACNLLYNELNKSNIDLFEYGYFREPSKEKSIINDTFSIKSILENKCRFTLWNKAYKTTFLKKSILNLPNISVNYADDAFLSILIAYDNPFYKNSNLYLYHYSFGIGISTMMIQDTQKVNKICSDLLTIKDNLLKIINIKNSKQLINSFMKFQYDYFYSLIRGPRLIHTIKNLFVFDYKLKTHYLCNLIITKCNKYFNKEKYND